MGKIGDLWVRLGLKKDDFSKGMDDAKKDVSGFGSAMGRMAGLAKAAWAAVAAAVVKFATDAVKLTQRWGDQWNVTMAGVRGAYQSFVRDLSNGVGWGELFQNMRDAYRSAKEVAAALDEVFERKVSFSYQEAAINKQIAELRNITSDTSKSDAERKQAAQQIIELEKQLGKVKQDIANQEGDARRKAFQEATHLNDEQTDFLVKNYNANREAIQDARAYGEQRLKLEKDIANAQRAASSGPAASRQYSLANLEKAKSELAELEAQTTDSVRAVWEMTKGYDRANDELVQGMAEAEVAAINAETEAINAQRNAVRTIGQIDNRNGMGAGTGAGKGTAEDDESLQQARAIQGRLDQAAKSEVQIMREKYEEEKALLEKHGMDTERLTQEYLAALIADAVEPGLDDISDAVDNFEPVEIEPLEIGDTTGVEEWIAELERLTEIAEDRAKRFKEAVVSGFSDGVQELTDQLFGLSEVNAGAILAALLTPLADMAIKEGELVMMQGIAIEAIKSALDSLNGPAAIAAGAALIAVGAAVKSGLSSLANTGGRTAGSTATSGAYAGGSTAAQVQEISSELTVYVKGEISGDAIVLSGERTINEWSR
jgi:hypothetical protein